MPDQIVAYRLFTDRIPDLDRTDQIQADAPAILALGVRVPVVTFVNNHFAVCPAGGFRGLSEGEASGAPGSGRDGAGSGSAFGEKIVAAVPPRK
jgi:hypothetical protein